MKTRKSFLIFLSFIVLFLYGCAKAEPNKDTLALSDTLLPKTPVTSEIVKEEPVKIAPDFYVSASSYNAINESKENRPFLLGAKDGIEIYGPDNLSYLMPYDGKMEISLHIKNTNPYDMFLNINGGRGITKQNFIGDISSDINEASIVVNSSEENLLIKRESEITMLIDVSIPSYQNEEAFRSNMDFASTFSFSKVGSSKESVNIPVYVINEVFYYSFSDVETGKTKDATIKGKVTDEEGNPISGALVKAYYFTDHVDSQTTNQNGEFSIKLSSCKSTATNSLRERAIKINAPGYFERTLCVYPKVQESGEITVTLHKKTDLLDYSVKKEKETLPVKDIIELPDSLKENRSDITDYIVSDDNIYLTRKSGLGSLECIDKETMKTVFSYKTFSTSSSISLSKDKEDLWFGSLENNDTSIVRNAIFSAKTGEIKYLLSDKPGLFSEFSKDGKYLAVKTKEGIEVYETKYYSCVYSINLSFSKEEIENHSLYVNEDASLILVPLCQDPKKKEYGSAFLLTSDLIKHDYSPLTVTFSLSCKDSSSVPTDYGITLEFCDKEGTSLGKYINIRGSKDGLPVKDTINLSETEYIKITVLSDGHTYTVNGSLDNIFESEVILPVSGLAPTYTIILD